MYLSLGHVIEGKADDSDDTTKKCRNSYKKGQASNNNIFKEMYHKVHITVNFRNGFLVQSPKLFSANTIHSYNKFS